MASNAAARFYPFPTNPRYDRYLAPAGRIAELIACGQHDKALLLFIHETEPVSLGDIKWWAKGNSDDSAIELAPNLLWGPMPYILADALVKLLQANDVVASGFVASDSRVMRGGLSRVIARPANFDRLKVVGAIEPRNGYQTPRVVIASLRTAEAAANATKEIN